MNVLPQIALRLSNESDCLDLLAWRNDPLSVRMSLSESEVNLREHLDWFHTIVNSDDTVLLIGINNGRKIGYCRFDIENSSVAEVSVAVNPSVRGLRFGDTLLRRAIKEFLKCRRVDLKAYIKKDNSVSRRLFESNNFSVQGVANDSNVLNYFRGFRDDLHAPSLGDTAIPKKGIHLEQVIGGDEQIVALYELLAKRQNTISHRRFPNFEEHTDFCKNNPYRVWYLITQENLSIGSIYLTYDNVIGLNLIQKRKTVKVIDTILSQVRMRWSPLEEVKSIRPPYFYLNVPKGDSTLMRVMGTLGREKIQSSFILN